MQSQKQVYKKKGEVTQEEKKSESPRKTEHHEHEEGAQKEGGYRGSRGSRGGNRGDRGGRGRGGDRPQTTQYKKKVDGEDQEEGKEKAEDEGKGGDRKQHRERPQQDENSYYYKYYYGQWPKHEKVQVTKETEVPTILAKELRKRNPDKVQFEKEMTALDKEIEDKKAKIVS